MLDFLGLFSESRRLEFPRRKLGDVGPRISWGVRPAHLTFGFVARMASKAVSSLTHLGQQLNQVTLETMLDASRANWRPLLLLAISALIAAIYLIGKPYIMYDDSDPLTYVRKAWSLIGREGGYNHAFRGPGYPIFLLLTGMATLDTWWVLIPSQIVMAVLLPVLIYGTLAPVTRNGAFVCGLLFMSYGVAYNHMNWVMSEELFLFVEFLAFFLVSRFFFHKGGRGTLYAISLLLAYAVTVRPAAALFFWIFLAVCLIFRRESWRRYIGPTIGYVSVMCVWSGYDYYHGMTAFPSGQPLANQSQRYFAEVFYGGGFHLATKSKATIQPSSGPASQKLYEVVRRYIGARRGQWGTSDPATARVLYDRFGTDEALVQAIFNRPNVVYFGLVTRAVNESGGGGDDLLRQVASEHGNTGLLALARYFYRHPLIPIMGAPQAYTGRLFMANFYRYSEMDQSRSFFVGKLDRNIIEEDAGPASREFYQTLYQVIDMFPQSTVHDSNRYLDIFGTVDNFKRYLANPVYKKLPDGRSVLGMAEGSIYIWLTLYYGDEKTDLLMKRVAFEVLAKHPNAWFLFFDSFLRATIMRDFFIDYGGSTVASFSAIWSYAKEKLTSTMDMRSSVLPPDLASHLTAASDLNNDILVVFFLQYYYLWRLTKVLFFFLMTLVIVPLLIVKRTAPLAGFLTLIYFYNAAALAIVLGQFDLPRWEDLFLFLPVMVSVMGLFTIPALARELRAAGSAASA